MFDIYPVGLKYKKGIDNFKDFPDVKSQNNYYKVIYKWKPMCLFMTYYFVEYNKKIGKRKKKRKRK